MLSVFLRIFSVFFSVMSRTVRLGVLQFCRLNDCFDAFCRASVCFTGCVLSMSVAALRELFYILDLCCYQAIYVCFSTYVATFGIFP